MFKTPTRALALILALIAGLSPAIAQVPSFPQTVPQQTVVGRLGIAPGPTQAIPIAQLAKIFGASRSVTTNAKCDGATDDTTAINADLAQGGYWTLPPNKTCNVTQLNITVSGTRLSGAGYNSSVLQGTTAVAPTINISATLSNVWLNDFQVTKSVTASAGGNGINFAGDCQYCVIDGVYAQKSYIGIAVQSTGVANMRHVLSQYNISDGIYLTNSNLSGAIQWDLDDVFSGQNGGRGFIVASGTPGPVAITLGSWHNVRTFANTGFGAVFAGTPSIPINGVRISKGFLGEDGGGEIYLDTYGGLHSIGSTLLELSGQSLTGPTFSTPASHVGDGIRITANNIDVTVSDAYINGNFFSGINTSATGNTNVSGGHISNHSQNGILAADCNLINVTGVTFVSNTSGNIACTTNSGKQVVAGNKPASLNIPSTRAVLTADTTFYVTTSGNNANGCTNNSTDACLTMQRAYDVLADGYDLRGYTATIQMGNGTYTAGLITSKCVPGQNGPGGVKILGSATPSNVLIAVTSTDAFGLGETAFGSGTQGCTKISIGGMKITVATSGNAINASGGGVGITVGTPGFPIEFGATAQDHMIGNHSAWIIAGTDNLVSGNALIHAAAVSNSVVALHGTTETFSNTPAFTYYAYADTNGTIFVTSMTFTNGGTVTGQRYYAANNAVVYALGGATYLPGSTAGQLLGGGQYVPTGGPTSTAHGAGIDTWLETPSSANLRAALTDETGTGAAYFQNGDIGTPSAGVGTNLTALNATNLASGTVPAARMPALTGDITSSVGGVATAYAGIVPIAKGGTGDALGVRLMMGGNTGAGVVAAGQTRYAGASLMDATESNVYVPVSFAGAFKNLVAISSGAPGAGQTYTVTFRNTLAATLITCTISGAGSNSCSDTTHSATFSAVSVDRYAVQVIASAGAASTNLLWSIEFDPTP